MRVTIKELMEKLGLSYVPGPYETVPSSSYNATRGVTCSAEIRMGMDSEEVDCEIQLLYDTPPEGKAGMEPICTLHAEPDSTGAWNLTSFRFRNAPFGADIYDWEEKACLFFLLCLQIVNDGDVPDFDELLDDAFHKRERYTDQAGGGGGGKSPKIRPAALLNAKRGGF